MKIILPVILLILLLYCSCKKESLSNKLPDAPVLTTPQNGVVCGSDTVKFIWQKSQDPEGDKILYMLYASKDSINWKYYSQTIDKTSFSIASSVFEPGKKYYWKVTSENYFDGLIIKHEEGVSVSNILYFYTTPPGINTLRDTSGHQFVNLTWKDPENLDHVEITFSPQVSGITQPIKVNAGVGKAEMKGFDDGIVYTFLVKTVDQVNHVSNADTIESMPLLPTQVHDADFNIYTTVTIGTQTWLRENLRTTKWQNGTPITYDNKPCYVIGSNSNTYGYYYYAYSFSPSTVTGNEKNPSPRGFHVPTDNDMKTLERYLGMPEDEVNSSGYSIPRGDLLKIGTMLKSKTGWNDFNGNSGNGTDLYAFNLLPAGYIDEGVEYQTGLWVVLWTSSGDGIINTVRIFSNDFNGIRNTDYGSQTTCSIRCIKD